MSKTTFTPPIDREILPAWVKPTHCEFLHMPQYGITHANEYSSDDLHLFNLDLNNFTYDGRVSIDLQLQERTSVLQLNTKQFTLKNACVGTDNKITDISIDTKSEVATLKLSSELPGEGTTKLVINFSGILNHEMAGFYRSAYRVDDQDAWMYSTQFESCDGESL